MRAVWLCVEEERDQPELERAGCAYKLGLRKGQNETRDVMMMKLSKELARGQMQGCYKFRIPSVWRRFYDTYNYYLKSCRYCHRSS